MRGALTKRERAAYALHTTAIRLAVDGAKAHVIAVYEQRLYREHGSFEQFCDDYGISAKAAYDWIKQAKVSTAVDKPVSQRMARELAQLPPEQQAEALRLAGGDEATSDKVRQVRELLEQMSPQELAAAIGRDEARGRQLDQKIGAQRRLKDIERLAARMKKIHAGLVDVADQADAALDAYLAIVRATGEAA
jgi:hypothetical protein